MASKIETNGNSKINAEQVIAARRLKVRHPELSAQAIKDQLRRKLSAIMVGRLLRGISHPQIDMCGLPVRPFNTEKPAKKTAKATKKAAKKTAPKSDAPAAA